MVLGSVTLSATKTLASSDDDRNCDEAGEHLSKPKAFSPYCCKRRIKMLSRRVFYKE